MSASKREAGAEAAATPEAVWAALQRTSDLIAKSRAESEAEWAKSRAESQAEWARLWEYQQNIDRQMEETDRRLKKAEDLFTSQWGRLMESLVEGDLVPLLKERGVEVERTLQRMSGRRDGEHYEIDIVAANGAEVVVVEVKTTLRSRDVTRFLGKLARFGDWFTEYEGRRVYGAVAYLRGDTSVTTQAERRGLFVIRATGSSASIVNEPDFEPRVFV